MLPHNLYLSDCDRASCNHTLIHVRTIKNIVQSVTMHPHSASNAYYPPSPKQFQHSMTPNTYQTQNGRFNEDPELSYYRRNLKKKTKQKSKTDLTATVCIIFIIVATLVTFLVILAKMTPNLGYGGT